MFFNLKIFLISTQCQSLPKVTCIHYTYNLAMRNCLEKEKIFSNVSQTKVSNDKPIVNTEAKAVATASPIIGGVTYLSSGAAKAVTHQFPKSPILQPKTSAADVNVELKLNHNIEISPSSENHEIQKSKGGSLRSNSPKKNTSATNAASANSNVKKTPKITANSTPKSDDTDDDIVCEKCHSGKQTPSNLIVLCDGCDKGWHQECHLPIITHKMVISADKWYCLGCYSLEKNMTN